MPMTVLHACARNPAAKVVAQLRRWRRIVGKSVRERPSSGSLPWMRWGKRKIEKRMGEMCVQTGERIRKAGSSRCGARRDAWRKHDAEVASKAVL
jgi:hypothetical protein